MDLQRKIRKNQNQMIICGHMLRFFAAWFFFKVLLYITFYNSTLREYITAFGGEYGSNPYFILFVEICTMIPVSLYSLLNLFVAKCAIDEGKNSKKHKTFLFHTIFILLITFLSAIINLNPSLVTLSINTIGDYIITILTDIINLIVLIQMIYSTLFLRKIRRQQN